MPDRGCDFPGAGSREGSFKCLIHFPVLPHGYPFDFLEPAHEIRPVRVAHAANNARDGILSLHQPPLDFFQLSVGDILDK